jgi:hypothetical protein
VLTGVLSEGDQGAKPSEEWTIDELKAAKPLFVYRFVDQLTDASDENYQFSQAFEIKILAKDESTTVGAPSAPRSTSRPTGRRTRTRPASSSTPTPGRRWAR